jgi:hypothetical protein
MATNYNYPDPANIEEAAKYRPGVASNIFNVLTGGLAGQITGSTQKAQEAARARQALLQEEFGKRDEQRTMERQLMINALQSGIEAPAGSTLEEKMADFRNKSLRRTLAAAQGATEGIKSPVGPYQSPYQFDPAFQISAAQAQADLEKRRVELQQTEDIQRRNLFNQAKGFGINVGPESTAGEIQAAIESKRPTIQAGAYTEEAGKRAIGELQAFQQTGDYPMVADVSKFSPARAIAEADIAKANYANRTKKYAFEEKYKVEQDALKGFMQELKSEKPDKDKLQSLYSQMPETSKITRDSELLLVLPDLWPRMKEMLLTLMLRASEWQELLLNQYPRFKELVIWRKFPKKGSTGSSHGLLVLRTNTVLKTQGMLL